MTNKMVIGYKFAFILLLLSSCVEDIRNCDIGNVDNMIPDKRNTSGGGTGIVYLYNSYFSGCWHIDSRYN